MNDRQHPRPFRTRRPSAAAAARQGRPPCRPHLESLEDRCLLSGDVVLQWNEVLLNAIRTDKTPPPPASRIMAIVHTAIYDAVNSIDGSATPYLVSKGGPKDASVEAAAAQAGYDTLAALYPQQRATFDTALQASLDAIPDGAAENKGIAVGRFAARMILAARADDGAAVAVPYTPDTGPGVWQPTPPALAAALFPQWPQVTPFTMTSGADFRPGGPPPLDSPAYATAFNEVMDLGGNGTTTPTSRTTEQTTIARFWADGAGTATPPGHWNLIAEDVARARGTTVVQNARLFALLNLALADAAICAWDAKYVFNYWRPVTAIRAADTDGNPDTAKDATWTPLLVTPAFPSYTSGHSTFSAAGAAVLAGFFGTDHVSFTTSSDALPGVTRSFPSFSAAAAEAGQSRIYGGIHYQFDNQDGLSAGNALGHYVTDHFLLPQLPAASRVFVASSGVRAGPNDSGLLTLAPARTLGHTPPTSLLLFPLPDAEGAGRLPDPTPGGGTSLSRGGDAGQSDTPGRPADAEPARLVGGILPATASHRRAAGSAWSPELDWDAALLADVAMALQRQ